MSIAEILSRLFLRPAELFLDMALTLLTRLSAGPGLSVLLLGVIAGLIAAPLVRRRKGREEGAEPVPVRKSLPGLILSLLMQGCFFAAAWRYFSSLKLVRGVSFGPIRDLGAGDGLLQAGGTAVHVLPLAAGALFLAAGLLRTRKLPGWHKLFVFLFSAAATALIYGGPSALALFWAGNGAAALLRGIADLGGKRMALNARQARTDRRNRILLACACLYLAVLTGLMIPSAILAASPAEFMDAHAYRNPDIYLLSAALTAAGLFLAWAPAYGLLLSPKARKRYTIGMTAAGAVFAVNYMFFGREYGIISSALQYETGISASVQTLAVNTAVLAAIAAAVILIYKKWPLVLRIFCLCGSAALIALSVINIVQLETKAEEVREIASRQTEEKATFRLSRSGKNVVVIMLDRTINGFVPFILNERPGLLEQFDGFTWYPNTLSYGYHTNIAAPALFGGYDYTPDNLLKRSELTLKEKHNEALKVMPVNFLEAGYEVTVCDAPYADYQWIPDMSIYDEYPEIRTWNTIGMFDEYRAGIQGWLDGVRDRNLFCYSLFRCAPSLLQQGLYDRGSYLQADAGAEAGEGQELFGVSADFLNSYMVMTHMADMTAVTDEDTGTFLMLTNEMTHNVIKLQEPDYIPKKHVDNAAYEAEHAVRVSLDGRELDLSACSELVQIHYHGDMSAFILLGQWFDELRAQGVYDNTRIILVSDHGCYLGLFGPNLSENNGELPDYPGFATEQWSDTTCYNPLLMVKDFGASGFTTDRTFMTNADTPSIACEGTVADPVNPFTGNPVSQSGKESGEQHIVESAWDIMTNNGTFFSDPLWITFRGTDVSDPANWFTDGAGKK